MILEVVTYPDKRLFTRSKEIFEFDEKLHKFLDDMYDTMLEKKGIGLAAVQVGHLLRIAVINLANDEGVHDPKDKIELINPEILSKDGEVLYEEGCLSVPGYFDTVKRYDKVKVKYQDRFGNFHQLDADGLLAICIQHEMDHLNGSLFIQKIGYQKRKKFDKEFKKKR